MDRETARDAFRGALAGTAVGDGLGAPFEGRQRVEEAALAAWRDAGGQLRWTDDTAMTIGLAESLAACGGFDGEDLARRFVERYDAEPWRGYGAAPPRVFAAIRAGAPWDAPAARLFGGQGSFGNGAAMRVAPAGLFRYRRLDRAAELARATAGITHTHELARQGAALQACATGWLVAARSRASALPARDLLAALRPLAPAEEYRHALDTVEALQERAGAAPEEVRARAVAELGNGIAAHEAVPAALHALLRHPDSFAGAVSYAVGLGGDTDTIAAMTGALAGAWLGYGAIPRGWLERLEAREDLVSLADRLLEADGGPEDGAG